MKMKGNKGLLTTLLRNWNSRALNRDMIGFALDEYEGIMDQEKVLAYSKATGDNDLVYRKEKAIIPPFYISSLVYDHLKYILTHKNLGLNILKMVHGEQEIIWHKPIHIGDIVRCRIFIKNIHDTPAGEMLVVSSHGYVGKDLSIEGEIGFLVRGGNGKSFGNMTRTAKPESTRSVLFSNEMRTWEGQQLAYAAVSGDHNFIHTSPLLARMAGLPRTILHGVCFMAMSCSSLTMQLLAGDLTRIKSITGRFSGFVLPGQTLTLVGYASPVPGELPFIVFNPFGKEVIKNGVFKFR